MVAHIFVIGCSELHLLNTKKLNLDWKEAAELRIGQLNEMDEFRLNAYERESLYKEKMKEYHDQRIMHRSIQKGDLVLLFNSKLKLFPGKLKYKWSGPFMVNQVYSSGVVELESKDGGVFKVNDQRVELYIGPNDLVKSISNIDLEEIE
ncbi:uncharacterized protein LOC124892760 [Capsicum annuum]|uniref:uncharacterized protein LOC124892760 n=1 Tax=Capsicum annuum TaxID=4072 RepID=UPI001FB0F8B4|nr:uncharacterized protein LOC124892760 [Capsicum annuum]